MDDAVGTTRLSADPNTAGAVAFIQIFNNSNECLFQPWVLSPADEQPSFREFLSRVGMDRGGMMHSGTNVLLYVFSQFGHDDLIISSSLANFHLHLCMCNAVCACATFMDCGKFQHSHRIMGEKKKEFTQISQGFIINWLLSLHIPCIMLCDHVDTC